MKITAIKYGESVYGEDHIFKGGSRDRLLPISFVIYLIQTGDRKILIDAGCDDGAGFEMSVFRRPSELLEEYGVRTGEISDLVLTHAHHDHAQAAMHYKNATVHIQTSEYSPARKYIPDGFNIHLFDEIFDLTDEITVKKIGGHTRGSCIVLAGSYVLCGDECYYKRCLTDAIPTGSSWNEEKSAGFIEQYRSEKYIPLLFHDPQILPGRVGWEEYEEF